MIAIKQMDVRANIKKYFDMAFNGEPVIVSRKEKAMLFGTMGIDGLAVVSAVIAQPDIKQAAADLKAEFCGRWGSCINDIKN